ncbi:MAG: GvpL/GvpF family gas vesicle protein [Pseudanabaenaceae cyanobacterium]
MLYTYAILLADAVPIPPLLGISGQPIHAIGTNELTAVVSGGINISSLRALPEPELIKAVLTHDQIICALFAHHTLLPLRFGTGFISENAVTSYLQSNQAHLLTQLRSLVGKAEYLLQITAKSLVIDKPTAPTGTAYLLAKKQQYQQQEQYKLLLEAERSAWLEHLQTWLTAQQIPYEIATTDPLKIYFLMTADQLTELPLHQLSSARWTWQISPPTPPYHFT